MKATCGGCDATWTGLKICHCASCHETFSVVAHFDKHRKGGACIPPEEIGLLRKDSGPWRGPSREQDG